MRSGFYQVHNVSGMPPVFYDLKQPSPEEGSGRNEGGNISFVKTEFVPFIAVAS